MSSPPSSPSSSSSSPSSSPPSPSLVPPSSSSSSLPQKGPLALLLDRKRHQQSVSRHHALARLRDKKKQVARARAIAEKGRAPSTQWIDITTNETSITDDRDPSAPTAHVYYCTYCSSYCITLSTPLHAVPTRQTDGAHVLLTRRLPIVRLLLEKGSQRVVRREIQDDSTSTTATLPTAEPADTQRTETNPVETNASKTFKYECQWRWNCRTCGLWIAYQCEPWTTNSTSDSSTSSTNKTKSSGVDMEDVSSAPITPASIVYVVRDSLSDANGRSASGSLKSRYRWEDEEENKENMKEQEHRKGTAKVKEEKRELVKESPKPLEKTEGKEESCEVQPPSQQQHDSNRAVEQPALDQPQTVSPHSGTVS